MMTARASSFFSCPARFCVLVCCLLPCGLARASVSYKGLYVVDRHRIGKPDCQQNLVRAWAEALHGPLASYAGKVLDINTPHLVYGPALNWSERHEGHELGQIHRRLARRKEGGIIAEGRLQMQPVACLDKDCNQATLVLLHDRNETRGALIGHQAWLVAGKGNGSIYQSTMPANIASYGKSFYGSHPGSRIERLGELTEVRLLSGPTWRPCAGRGIAVPIEWNSQTSQDTDTVCVRDSRGNSAIIGNALDAGILSGMPTRINISLASNPVLCNTSVYVAFGRNTANIFSRVPPHDAGAPFVSCSYNGSHYRAFLRSALENLESLETCNWENAGKVTARVPGRCPAALSCARVYRQMASLHSSIVNQDGRQISEVHSDLEKPYIEPGLEPNVDVCYGSWPYLDPLPPTVDAACQLETNEGCDRALEFVLYTIVLDFTANILYDQAVNLALAQKRLEIPQAITPWGAIAAVFLAATAAIGAIPSARQSVVTITWGWPHKRRLLFVSACMVLVGVMSASAIWQLLIGIRPYLETSYYYIPVSTEHVASATPQPLYFVGFAVIEVHGEWSVLGALVTGGILVTFLVLAFVACAFFDHVQKRKLVDNKQDYIRYDAFGAAESLTEADALLLHVMLRQIRPEVNAQQDQVIGIINILDTTLAQQNTLTHRIALLEERLASSQVATNANGV